MRLAGGGLQLVEFIVIEGEGEILCVVSELFFKVFGVCGKGVGEEKFKGACAW